MLIDGKSTALAIRLKIKDSLKGHEKRPGLAFILIGEDPASNSYVTMKGKACAEVGFFSKIIKLSANVSKHELLETIYNLNEDVSIDGILIQQPFPKHLPTDEIVEAIDPKKDVDGFHPMNLGKLIIQDDSGFIPCTPYGILKLLEAHNIPLGGKHAVVIGRSQIVGKPLANLLSQKRPFCDATVTLCHSGTKNLKDFVKSADCVIAAIGKPKFITADMVKEGSIIIDVGINRIHVHGETKIVGDVDFDAVYPHVHAITPVPGGVGPMTIAMLLENTYKSYLRKHS